jgi:Phage-related protein
LHGVTLLVNFVFMDRKREILFFEQYFLDFVGGLPQKVRDKVAYVLYLIAVSERIPVKFFKHIEGTDGLFEIRVEFESNIYRVFCCFDEGRLVVLFNGFQKKTQKTPHSEIEKALRIMKDYFKSK